MTKLFIVPTPIGNLQDISFRAIDTLRSVGVIASEDTRKTSILLKTYEINTPLTSLHQHNEHQKTDRILQDALENKIDIAVVTDAGTPGISDPGYLIVKKAIEFDIEVQTLPGANAFVPALVNSGLPCDKFVFEGFLPHKKGRKSRLEFLKEEPRTIIFYESPHRLLKTIKDFIEHYGEERKFSVSREISKKFEETIRGTLKEVYEYFEKHTIKGEFVLVLEGKK